MMKPTRRAPLMALLVLASAWAQTAFAHEGHDAPNPHLHGPDWLGLVALAAVGAAVLWFVRRK